MNPITKAREQAERWLDDCDRERDRLCALIALLRAAEHNPAMLFARRPRRRLKAVIQKVKQDLKEIA